MQPPVQLSVTAMSCQTQFKLPQCFYSFHHLASETIVSIYPDGGQLPRSSSISVQWCVVLRYRLSLVPMLLCWVKKSLPRALELDILTVVVSSMMHTIPKTSNVCPSSAHTLQSLCVVYKVSDGNPHPCMLRLLSVLMRWCSTQSVVS